MLRFPLSTALITRLMYMSLIVTILLVSAPCRSSAAALKTYVGEFSVIGVPNRDELKVTLQGLLSSRLNPGRVQLVEKPVNAELLLTGSYALFGKMFSIDVLIKNTVNGSLTKVFEQGESQDDLLPAFGRLAQKLDRELAGIQPFTAVPPAPVPTTAPSPVPAPVAAKSVAPVTSYKVEAPVVVAGENYVVKSENAKSSPAVILPGEPLTGIFTSLALGRVLASGEQEIFIAGEHSIRYLRKGSELKQIAEIPIPVPAKILAIDSADLDHDGIPEIYVSIVDRKTVSSRVYQPAASGMELIAEGQPWLFRGIGSDLKERIIFAQGLNSSGEYFGEVAELVKSDKRFDTRNGRTLPRSGNVFSFTRFRDAAGAEKMAVLDEEGYLTIYAADGSKLWKSSDKYGGSESYFNFETVAQTRGKGNAYNWHFLEQRIMSLPDGTLIVPRNEGTLKIGNNRSYNKHSLIGLQWNGYLLKEAWYTRQTPTYLADYAYIPGTREVVLLEVIQRSGLFDAGKTSILINKLD